tara:strand:+ start:570 stop:782 length:213 start_codon:yes stop_codon:yes gene_type:complete
LPVLLSHASVFLKARTDYQDYLALEPLSHYFSCESHTAKAPVIAPVTTEIKEACCVDMSGIDNAHSMQRT